MTERISPVWRWVKTDGSWWSVWKSGPRPKKGVEGMVLEDAHVIRGPLHPKLKAKIEKLLRGGCAGCP